jgi:Pvc16 N-terminal domain
MSNTLAIGAVTATLRQLLSKVAEPLPLDPAADPDLADATCTARPPDKARTAEDSNQLNLFLYQTAPNAALRNYGMPGTNYGDSTLSPLALNLYYLVTAYGRDHDDVLSHRLLGRAMSLLHDHSTLFPVDIEKALPGSGLSAQFDKVRLAPQPMNTEELAKLWATFQTPYRISAAYEARVVLIESGRHSRAALPVIRRGPEGRGNESVANLVPMVPQLTGITLPLTDQPAALLPYTDPNPINSKLGDLLIFEGHDLTGIETDVLFQHRLTTITVTPPTVQNANVNGFRMTLPDAPGTWPAGMYSVGAQLKPSMGSVRTTNVLPLNIAPRIVGVGTPAVDPDGNVTLQITVSPPVWAEQRVSLIVGDLEYAARPLSGTPTTTVSFDVTGRGTGTFPLRARVDGVDSFLVLYGSDPMQMDPLAPTVTLP